MNVKKNLFPTLSRFSWIPPSLRAPNQREEFAISHRCQDPNSHVRNCPARHGNEIAPKVRQIAAFFVPGFCQDVHAFIFATGLTRNARRFGRLCPFRP
jgi:hypothetical protein